MTNQEMLDFKDKAENFKDKYKNNPIAFAEDFCGVKLYPWQKVLLNTWNSIDHCKEYICNIPYRNGKKMVRDTQFEYMKAMEMDFKVWKPEGIDVYEKGVLVRTIRKEIQYENHRTKNNVETF